ncbi:MAG TPA: ABC transporter permease [Candidatus Limnocylindrales bacterium]|nr:ABC transporter permease [Candidatus Limnocylindrales bacterium]
MRPILAVVIRLLAFVGKELIETLRRPGAIVSLILGPFLIMAVFGLGYSGVKRPLETVVVAPASSQLPSDAAAYQALAGEALHIDEVTRDRDAAEARLRAGVIDVVIVAPEDPEAQFRAGKQSVIEVLVDEVDPVAENYAVFLGSGLASAVNREVIRRVAEEGQGYAVAAGEPDAEAIPPDVVAAPTRSELVNAAPSRPGVISFFAPAVLALILQHLAVTLIAMSLVRERTSGLIELFRIAPVSTAEVMIGKILAFGILGAAIGAITIALMIVGFHVPAIGPPGAIALAVGLLLLASLGLGLLIAVLSDSERQAVQLSLLVLLASVFFSGFVLSIDEFSEPVRAVAYALPVTHGIRLLQDLMLRGTTNHAWEFLALGVIAAVTLVAAWLILRRGMARA